MCIQISLYVSLSATPIPSVFSRDWGANEIVVHEDCDFVNVFSSSVGFPDQIPRCTLHLNRVKLSWSAHSVYAKRFADSARFNLSWAKLESLKHEDLCRAASSFFRIGLRLPYRCQVCGHDASHPEARRGGVFFGPLPPVGFQKHCQTPGNMVSFSGILGRDHRSAHLAVTTLLLSNPVRTGPPHDKYENKHHQCLSTNILSALSRVLVRPGQ